MLVISAENMERDILTVCLNSILCIRYRCNKIFNKNVLHGLR